ncbi:PIN domain-containing protein [Candidatus Woesearchaeota archaeon]|nr:PIN domain-containing protein [Candidatus Woesearchaeota archaeon]
MKIYLDTNIYIDFLENRADMLRPLGELAFQCFKQSLGCEFYIVISNHVIKELKDLDISEKQIKEIIAWIDSKLIKIHVCRDDMKKARIISKEFNLHYKDALHYQLTKRSADKLLTNDNELKQLPICIGYESL